MIEVINPASIDMLTSVNALSPPKDRVTASTLSDFGALGGSAGSPLPPGLATAAEGFTLEDMGHPFFSELYSFDVARSMVCLPFSQWFFSKVLLRTHASRK
jgi:hypothetical protein